MIKGRLLDRLPHLSMNFSCLHLAATQWRLQGAGAELLWHAGCAQRL